MNYRVTRRDFLAATTAATALPGAPAPIGDIKPALYSITYLGYWYRGEALNMDQLLERAKRFGYDGLEIEGKRPHGCPLDWPKRRCDEFRKKAAGAGIAITNVAADNDFSSPISEHREAQLALVRDMIRMTADLGAKNLRVFLAWAGATRLPQGGGRYDIAQKVWDVAHEDFPEDRTWAWCRECLTEAARWAGDYGVTLALQNHKPITIQYPIMLRMIKEVNSPNLKACMDAPLMENKDPMFLRKAVQEVGKLQVHTHFGGDYEQKGPGQPIRQLGIQSGWRQKYVYQGYVEKDFTLPFFRALLETGYRGYAGYELCHPLPVVNGQLVGIDYVDRNAELAAKFIRGVIAQAKRDLAQGKVSG